MSAAALAEAIPVPASEPPPLFAHAGGDIDVSFEFFPPKTDQVKANPHPWESTSLIRACLLLAGVRESGVAYRAHGRAEPACYQCNLGCWWDD